MPTDKNCQVCTAAWPLFCVCLLHGVTNGIVQVVCDNNKSLFLSSKKLKRVRQKRKHEDILWAICKVQTSVPLVMDFNNLRGHQDKRIPAQLMEFPSKIKIECNGL